MLLGPRPGAHAQAAPETQPQWREEDTMKANQPMTMPQWLRLVRDDLRACGTKREIPGRTAARQRARAHLRRASRLVTAALRALEEGSRR